MYPISGEFYMVGSAITQVSGAAPTTTLPDGEPIPALGQGTWHMAEDPRRWHAEVSTLQVGVDLGLTLIDTAEMYADGRAEELVGTERLDLYLLHWREDVPLEATLEGFQALVRAGMIRHWGVSNFDVSDMQELERLPSGTSVATDQVLYNLARRGIEWDLLPWCRARRIPIMAYSPIEQGRMLKHPVLRRVATRHGATPAQVALAWLLRQELLCAIPKAATPEHVRENRAALEVRLTDQDLAELDRAFPPPDGPRPLEML